MEIIFSGSIEDNVARAANLTADLLKRYGYAVEVERCNHWQVRLTARDTSANLGETIKAYISANTDALYTRARCGGKTSSPEEKFDAYLKQRTESNSNISPMVEQTAMQVALASLKSEQALEDHKKACSEQLEKVRSQVGLFPLRKCQEKFADVIMSTCERCEVTTMTIDGVCYDCKKTHEVDADPKPNGGW